MSVFYNLYKSNRNDDTKGLWYAKVVIMGTANLDYLANEVQKNVSMKTSDVQAVIKEFFEQLSIALMAGYSVDLGSLGIMRLALSSGPAATAAEWTQEKNLKGIHICYQEKRKKDSNTGVYNRTFSSNYKLVPLPIQVKKLRESNASDDDSSDEEP